IERFAEEVRHALQRWCPRHVAEGRIGPLWADPAGAKRDEVFEVAVFDHLRRHGFDARPAPTQDPRLRVQAISAPCERMIDGRPGLLVSREGAPWLHKGLLGGWHYKRLRVSGDERYADKPVKNDYSHVCDALGYALLGGGELAEVRHGSGGGVRVTRAEVSIDPLAW
ncbi:MAG: TerL, partial [Alphaproteobacteria bacterium]